MPQRLKSRTEESYFFEGFEKQDDGCWLWKSQPKARYPRIYWYGRPRPVSVISYLVHHGPIPDGMKVCHTCDVPRCVNPDHLFLGTQADNLKDMGQKGRHGAQRDPEGWVSRIGTAGSHPGEKNPAAKLTQERVEEIRRVRADEGLSYSQLVARFGVSKSQVARIVKGESWA